MPNSLLYVSNLRSVQAIMYTHNSRPWSSLKRRSAFLVFTTKEFDDNFVLITMQTNFWKESTFPQVGSKILLHAQLTCNGWNPIFLRPLIKTSASWCFWLDIANTNEITIKVFRNQMPIYLNVICPLKLYRVMNNSDISIDITKQLHWPLANWAHA